VSGIGHRLLWGTRRCATRPQALRALRTQTVLALFRVTHNSRGRGLIDPTHALAASPSSDFCDCLASPPLCDAALFGLLSKPFLADYLCTASVIVRLAGK